MQRRCSNTGIPQLRAVEGIMSLDAAGTDPSPGNIIAKNRRRDVA